MTFLIFVCFFESKISCDLLSRDGGSFGGFLVVVITVSTTRNIVISSEEFENDLNDDAADTGHKSEGSAWSDLDGRVVDELGAAPFTSNDAEANAPVDDTEDEGSEEEDVVDDLEGGDGEVKLGLDEANDGQDPEKAKEEDGKEREGLSSVETLVELVTVECGKACAAGGVTDLGAGLEVGVGDSGCGRGFVDENTKTTSEGKEQSADETSDESNDVLDGHFLFFEFKLNLVFFFCLKVLKSF